MGNLVVSGALDERLNGTYFAHSGKAGVRPNLQPDTYARTFASWPEMWGRNAGSQVWTNRNYYMNQNGNGAAIFFADDREWPTTVAHHFGIAHNYKYRGTWYLLGGTTVEPYRTLYTHKGTKTFYDWEQRIRMPNPSGWTMKQWVGNQRVVTRNSALCVNSYAWKKVRNAVGKAFKKAFRAGNAVGQALPTVRETVEAVKETVQETADKVRQGVSYPFRKLRDLVAGRPAHPAPEN